MKPQERTCTLPRASLRCRLWPVEQKAGYAMKKTMTGLVLAVMAASGGAPAATAGQSYQAGGTLKGTEFVSRRAPDVERQLWLMVAAGDDGSAWVRLNFETHLGIGSLSLQNSAEERARLRSALNKALEWAVVALANEADTRKFVGCFGNDFERETCEEWGRPLAGHFVLTFISIGGGQKSFVTLWLKDLTEERRNASISLDIVQIRELIAALDDVEAARARAAAMDAKADVFQ